MPLPLAAAVFLVDSYVDEVDTAPGDGVCATISSTCTLRAAVQEASHLAGADEIQLPAGIYTLTLAGPGEDGGDLDVSSGDLTITGAGASTTIIDAAGVGRVFEVGFGVASLSLFDLTIRNGDASVEPACGPIELSAGGGVCGSVSLTRVVVENNTAAWGGGIFGGGDISDSVIRNNASTGQPGGGIANPGAPLEINGTTISGNSAGGGVYTFFGGSLSIRNSTISGNTGFGLLGDGGCDGSSCIPATVVILNNVTIAENTSGGLHAQLLSFPGGHAGVAPVTISNTLMTGNGSSDCSGHIVSAGYNVITVAGCALDGDASGNVFGRDGLIGPLAANGGPSDTHALADGSPAKNSGSPAVPGSGAPACEAFDQRGVARPIGARCDVGAVESPCGDGVVDSLESCDDGNAIDGDGCDSNCTITACGNGLVTAGEECDDGNTMDGDGCNANCLVEFCGNGIVEPNEVCDDGNTDDGDGCEGDCLSFTPVCSGGTTIANARIAITMGAAPMGDEGLVFKGRLSFAAGAPVDFDPASAGAQILIEDIGSGNGTVFDLTYLTVPIPGSGSPPCDPVRDGWKQNATGTRVTYRNRSGALAVPACTSGSANGLRLLRFVDRRASRQEVAFLARAKGAGIGSPVGPLRATIVTGASPSSGSAGHCGVHTFDASACGYVRGGRVFRCR